MGLKLGKTLGIWRKGFDSVDFHASRSVIFFYQETNAISPVNGCRLDQTYEDWLTGKVFFLYIPSHTVSNINSSHIHI